MAAAPFSETLRDDSAGPNNSFELSRDGWPLNWSLYTPATTGSKAFTLSLDATRAVSGKQSLRITTQAPHAQGGRFAPGFFREVPAQPGDVWEVSFKAWSSGAEFVMEAGAVSAKQAGPRTELRWKETDAGWKPHQLKVRIPEGMTQLRIQFNVLGVGSVNVDDVVLTRLSQRPPQTKASAAADNPVDHRVRKLE